MAASKGAGDKNPYNAVIKDFDVRLGGLREKFHPFQTNVLEKWRQQYAAGKFRQIKAIASRHTMLRAKDGAVIGYLVPADCLEGLDHNRTLSTLISNLPPNNSNANAKGIDRGVLSSRCYCTWAPYKDQPIQSAAYKSDGEAARSFIQEARPLWNRATQIMRKVFPKTYKLFTAYPLPGGLSRMAGAWMGCAINAGSMENPVQTKEHRDVKGALFGMSCLCALGDYVGGDLIIWELQVIVELRPGDLFIFPDHLFNHSNTEVHGVRHSLVAFTRQEMIDWQKRTYGHVDSRLGPTRDRQKVWRKKDRQKKKPNRRLSFKTKK